MEIALVFGMRITDFVARSRAGFTLIEVLIVVVIGGIAGAVAVPSISRSLAQSRVHNTATVIAADIQLAHSMAGRQRRPVTIQIDVSENRINIFDTATPSTVYSSRYLGQEGGYAGHIGGNPLGMTSTVPQVTVFPSGLASGSLEIRLGSLGARRTITMSRAGQVRVSGK